MRAPWVRWWLRELVRSQARPLLAMALAALSGCLFLWIAGEMIEGDTHAVDERLLLALRQPGDRAEPIGPARLAEAARDVTALGSVTVLTFVTLAAAGYLLVARKSAWAVFLLLSVGSGWLIERLLKTGFARPRPDLVAPLVRVYSLSFPSGHAMLSAIVYLTLGALVGQAQERRAVGGYLLAVAMIITLAVGCTRVFLGVHWPSDVVAGWSAGAAWALICWLVAYGLRWRRARPQSAPAP